VNTGPVKDQLRAHQPEQAGGGKPVAKSGMERNNLLALMTNDAKERLFPLLREVELPLGEEVYAAGQAVKYVYFPADCIVSLLYVMLDGHSAEISVVGCEGVVGIAVFMGGDSTPSRAVVQSAGTAYRLPAVELKKQFNHDADFRVLMLRYTQALITQMAQTAVCNRHHSIDQQLCRWLLLSLDRLPTNQLTMTQELIANMLGVRREGVTESAGKLQKLGAIEYQRGKITVLDRPMVEELSCECYAVVKEETERLADYAKKI
jgi:CRP-like cAMP-binding protein